MSNKEQIIKYLLTRERFGDNCVHFTQACYDKFPKILPKEIKSILLSLADEGFIECKFLTHKEKSMCWIRLKSPILNYKEEKQKARWRSVKAIWNAIDIRVRWAIGAITVPLLIAIVGWLISRA